MLKFLRSQIQTLLERLTPAREIVIVDGDTLPKSLPPRNLVLAREDGEDWCVGMRCPCGCGRAIELQVFPEARPKWRLVIDGKNRPTLYPSVWVKDGCRSHFWLQKGKVFWC